jgi:hypothetical protein
MVASTIEDLLTMWMMVGKVGGGREIGCELVEINDVSSAPGMRSV